MKLTKACGLLIRPEETNRSKNQHKNYITFIKKTRFSSALSIYFNSENLIFITSCLSILLKKDF